jgi:tripartite-type tricarboxylate transporter receptor subunit TctC
MQKSSGPINIANLSPGTRSDMLGELLSEKSGGKITAVPYKRLGPCHRRSDRQSGTADL